MAYSCLKHVKRNEREAQIKKRERVSAKKFEALFCLSFISLDFHGFSWAVTSIQATANLLHNRPVIVSL